VYLDVVLDLLVPLLGGGELSIREGLPEALLREERLQLQEGGHLAVLGDEFPVICEEVDWEGNENYQVPCCGCPTGSSALTQCREEATLSPSPPREPSASLSIPPLLRKMREIQPTSLPIPALGTSQRARRLAEMGFGIPASHQAQRSAVAA